MNTEQRLKALEDFVASLKTSSGIPYEVLKSFSGGGVLNTTNFIVLGKATLSAAGVFKIGIPGATSLSFAVAHYSTFPDTGLVDAYIEPNSVGSSGYELHLEGLANKTVNYIVFLNNGWPIMNLV